MNNWNLQVQDGESGGFGDTISNVQIFTRCNLDQNSLPYLGSSLHKWFNEIAPHEHKSFSVLQCLALVFGKMVDDITHLIAYLCS